MRQTAVIGHEWKHSGVDGRGLSWILDPRGGPPKQRISQWLDARTPFHKHKTLPNSSLLPKREAYQLMVLFREETELWNKVPRNVKCCCLWSLIGRVISKRSEVEWKMNTHSRHIDLGKSYWYLLLIVLFTCNVHTVVVLFLPVIATSGFEAVILTAGCLTYDYSCSQLFLLSQLLLSPCDVFRQPAVSYVTDVIILTKYWLNNPLSDYVIAFCYTGRWLTSLQMLY